MTCAFGKGTPRRLGLPWGLRGRRGQATTTTGVPKQKRWRYKLLSGMLCEKQNNNNKKHRIITKNIPSGQHEPGWPSKVTS